MPTLLDPLPNLRADRPAGEGEGARRGLDVDVFHRGPAEHEVAAACNGRQAVNGAAVRGKAAARRQARTRSRSNQRK